MGTTLRTVGIAVAFVLTFVFGYWVSHQGKPYNAILFNIHKLIALAVVILFTVTLFRTGRPAGLGAVEIIASVVTGLFLVGLFVTGALLSTDRSMPAIVLRLHHITPYLAVLSTAVTLYLLLSRK
jgi:hypothetical protein